MASIKDSENTTLDEISKDTDKKKLSNSNLIESSKIITIACYGGIPFIVTSITNCPPNVIFGFTAIGLMYGGIKQLGKVKTSKDTTEKITNKDHDQGSIEGAP